jgi:ACT domain-containing protein
MKAIVTVLGKDKIGITANVTGILANHGVNILDISQTIVQGYFTMIMLVDLEKLNVTFDELRDILDKKGKEIGLSIKIQLEEVFNYMHHV